MNFSVEEAKEIMRAFSVSLHESQGDTFLMTCVIAKILGQHPELKEDVKVCLTAIGEEIVRSKLNEVS